MRNTLKHLREDLYLGYRIPALRALVARVLVWRLLKILFFVASLPLMALFVAGGALGVTLLLLASLAVNISGAGVRWFNLKIQTTVRAGAPTVPPKYLRKVYEID